MGRTSGSRRWSFKNPMYADAAIPCDSAVRSAYASCVRVHGRSTCQRQVPMVTQHGAARGPAESRGDSEGMQHIEIQGRSDGDERDGVRWHIM